MIRLSATAGLIGLAARNYVMLLLPVMLRAMSEVDVNLTDPRNGRH